MSIFFLYYLAKFLPKKVKSRGVFFSLTHQKLYIISNKQYEFKEISIYL